MISNREHQDDKYDERKTLQTSQFIYFLLIVIEAISVNSKQKKNIKTRINKFSIIISVLFRHLLEPED